jgi:uncharacterized protein with NAD-binding domain and iron-sulfur cluster
MEKLLELGRSAHLMETRASDVKEILDSRSTAPTSAEIADELRAGSGERAEVVAQRRWDSPWTDARKAAFTASERPWLLVPELAEEFSVYCSPPTVPFGPGYLPNDT